MSTTSNVSAGKRIEALLDDNSFVEIGSLVRARNTDFNMTQKETPADGVITGYGVINGVLVYVYSQDATVLGGSIGEMHAKKIIRLYDMAMKMGAPVWSCRLCRIKTGRSNRCIKCIWRALLKTVTCFRCDSTDNSSFWDLRWWTCSIKRIIRFHIYGGKRKIIR